VSTASLEASGAPTVTRASCLALPRLGPAALPFLLVLGLIAMSPASAAAQGDDDPAALALLRRAIAAAATVTYRGEQVDVTWTSAGMTTRILDVAQGAGLRQTTARAGGGGTSTTTTDSVRAPVAGIDPLTLLAGAYAVALAGRDQIAGRAAFAVVALRGGRVAARLWLDSATGLLLRQEIWDARHLLTRMVSFRTIRVIGAGSGGATGLVPAAAPDLTVQQQPGAGAGASGGGGGETPQAAALRLHSRCPDVLPGGFRLVDVREEQLGPSAGRTALHLTYSDGLSGLSVFEQAGRLPAAGVSGWSAQEWGGTRVWVGGGWPLRAVWQGGGRVYTAVSDAPLDELTAAVTVLPGRDTPGMVQRVEVLVHAAAVLLPGH
jgi:sigma-E factor negative regulatory protein RseB